MSYSFERCTRLEVGDKFYESNQQFTAHMRVTSTPIVDLNEVGCERVRFTARPVEGGYPIKYNMTRGLEHYGPRLYDHPAYSHYRRGYGV